MPLHLLCLGMLKLGQSLLLPVVFLNLATTVIAAHHDEMREEGRHWTLFCLLFACLLLLELVSLFCLGGTPPQPSAQQSSGGRKKGVV